MKNINSYATTFKSCDQRIQKNFHLMIKIYLKQNDFNELIKKTHNKFISNEMIVVIIILENLERNQSIKRDILIQNIDNNLISIFYWQLCYMSLWYSLIFSHDEQSWNAKISLQNHQINKDLLTRKVNKNDISRHRMFCLNDNELLHEIFVAKNDDKNEKIYEINVQYNKKESKRTTQIKFYRFLLQINQFVQILAIFWSLRFFYSKLISFFSFSLIRNFFFLLL